MDSIDYSYIGGMGWGRVTRFRRESISLSELCLCLFVFPGRNTNGGLNQRFGSLDGLDSSCVFF